jgi:uncharacterized protein involved in type VI secretion and phage assembly
VNLSGLVPDGSGTLADASGRIYGVVTGVVTDNKDPDGMGRVKVRLPWLAADVESTWARIATPMAGNERGLALLPEVDDEVLVAFAHGVPAYPYVLGALWNGKDKPPETNADGNNDKRVIVSRSGLRVLLDDAAGAERIELADKEGQLSIVVDVANKKVTVTSGGDVEISAAQGTVAISGQTVKLSSTGATEIKATGTLDLGGQSVNVKGQPMVNIN